VGLPRCVPVGEPLPTNGGLLCLGRAAKRLEGAPGRYELRPRTVLRCPWHGWEFDLEAGLCVEHHAMRVAIYPVRVEAGRVLVAA